MKEQDAEKLRTLVFTALFEATVAWPEPPTGMAHLPMVESIGEKLLTDIKNILTPLS